MIDSIDSVFSQAFAGDGPGGAVIIAKGGKVIFDKGYGLADLETGAAIDGNTFFNIGSMSKQFTSIAILQLSGEGKLSLDDNIHKYFPEFKADFWDRVTIHNLLSHTSGVPDARGGFPREVKVAATDSVSVSYLYDLDHLNFEPGESYEYINPTYVLLGMIVEKASGQAFEDYMREHLFNPAGMKEAIYYAPGRDSVIPSLSHGYVFNKQDSLWHEDDFGEATFFATRPDGGLYTSTHEFLAWERGLHSGAVISKELLELAQTPKVSTGEGTKSKYGYGWNLQYRENMPLNIWHAGVNGGYRAIGAYYPEADTDLIVFSNRADFDFDGCKAKVEEIMGI